MSYSASWDEAYRTAGIYVSRILKGAKPAELPFQQSSQFELAINLKAAETLRVSIAPDFLLRVDYIVK